MQLEEHEGLISQWRFPGECMQGDCTGDATQQLKGYLELLRNTVLAADLLRNILWEIILKTARLHRSTIFKPSIDTRALSPQQNFWM